MSKKFESNLVGRKITPIPPKTKPNYHLNDKLPQGVIYQIHTVYLEEGEPVALAEKVSTTGKVEEHRKLMASEPAGAKVWVGTLGMLWELMSG